MASFLNDGELTNVHNNRWTNDLAEILVEGPSREETTPWSHQNSRRLQQARTTVDSLSFQNFHDTDRTIDCVIAATYYYVYDCCVYLL